MTLSDQPIGQDIEVDLDETYGVAESWLERRLVDVRDAMRDEPIKTTLIAMVAGALLGRIFLR